MRFVVVALALIFATASLAGCLTSSREGGALDSLRSASIQAGSTNASGRLATRAAASTPAVVNLTTDRPAKWVRGEWWTYKMSGGTNPVTAVVVEANGGGYKLAVDDPDMAIYDAASDVSWLGDRGADLSGSQSTGAVQFYAWPLTDGAKWQTKWDGLLVNITAHRAGLVPTPHGPEAGFELIGTVGSTKYVTYNYAPSVGTFTHMSFGEFGLDMTASGLNFSGKYLVESAKVLADVRETAPTPGGSGGPLTVDAGQAALVVQADVRGDTALAGAYVLYAPGGTLVDNYAAAPGPAGASDFVMVPSPAAGNWAYAIACETAQVGACGFRLVEVALTPTSL